MVFLEQGIFLKARTLSRGVSRPPNGPGDKPFTPGLRLEINHAGRE
jgi:hypothetical protein